MDCGTKLLQMLICVFNLIFFISGIALIAVGSVVIADEDAYVALISYGVVQVSILLIVIGCIIVVVTFFGCCGAMKQSKCMLHTFSALLCIIFICEFAGGIAAFVYRADIKSEVTTQLQTTMADYSTDKQIAQEWDNMQRQLKCCGVSNSSDWGEPVPESCCQEEAAGCSKDPNNVYEQGCIDAAVQVLDDNAVLIGGIACGLAFIEILGIIFACCFASDIH